MIAFIKYIEIGEIMSITINYYPKKQNMFSLGLGQDVGSLRTVIDVLQIFIKDSAVQRECIRRFRWRLKDKKLENKLTNILKTEPVTPTVTDLTAEYPKITGKPASIYAKSILGTLLDGQKWVVDRNKRRIKNKYGKEFKYPMRSWPMRNFVSLIVGLGLLSWDRVTGKVALTEVGKKLALTQHGKGEVLSTKEIKLMTEVFMSYPYTVGFMRALAKSKKELTKFELGEKFGFVDEPGFTNFGAQLYIESLKDALARKDKNQVKEIRSNWEGTSDKYIRGFASMLGKLNLVKSIDKKFPYVDFEGRENYFTIPAYRITGMGKQALGQALGKSSHRRTTKNVMWDMLATHGEVVYIRTVRSLILKALSETISGLKADQIADVVNSNKVNEKHVLNGEKVTPDEVEDHIAGINGLGLEIQNKNGIFILKDKITDFEIPVIGDDLPQKTNVLRQQDELRPLLKNINHRYLQLIELALDSNSNQEYSQFESLTMELLFKQLEFNGVALGGAGKPDGFAWDSYGNSLIVDTKAYEKGYSLSGNTDKVVRYITDIRNKNENYANHWWKTIPKDLDVENKLRFIYVSGTFTGRFRQLLKDLKSRTEAKGGLVEVTKLLLSGEVFLRSKEFNHRDLLNEWTNDKILKEEYFDGLKAKLD